MLLTVSEEHVVNSAIRYVQLAHFTTFRHLRLFFTSLPPLLLSYDDPSLHHISLRLHLLPPSSSLHHLAILIIAPRFFVLLSLCPSSFGHFMTSALSFISLPPALSLVVLLFRHFTTSRLYLHSPL
jgi:hypothetical protein